jgi:hypothetical protein
MKTTTGLTGFVATNAGGTTKLSTHPGNEEQVSKCRVCDTDLSAEGIKDLIPLCHTCYVQENDQVERYLQELKEMSK